MEKCLTHVPPGGRVKLRSAPAAVPFYEKFGFEVHHLPLPAPANPWHVCTQYQNAWQQADSVSLCRS